MKRNPAVAGQFYNASATKLTHQVQQYTTDGLPREHAIGIIAPHAGLIYSGSVAGEVYSRIIMPRTFLLLGPNHTGLGAPAAIMHTGEWEIPTRTFRIDETLSQKIMAHSPLVSPDVQAHLFEHSLEVQLPFLAYFTSDAMITPLTVMSASVSECRAIGEGIARAIRETEYPVLLIASSDMSHYVSEATARKKDGMAIERILSLDPEGLYDTVRSERISMCGFLPATIMLFAALSLGAKSARLVKYTTSGEVSGDYDQVVGYAGIIVS